MMRAPSRRMRMTAGLALLLAGLVLLVGITQSDAQQQRRRTQAPAVAKEAVQPINSPRKKIGLTIIMS